MRRKKTKKKININILIILVFIAMITVPQFWFWCINGKETQVSNTENRELATKPELKLETILDFPKNFDDYYNDNLPFRKKLREYWTNFNYELFNTTVDSRVLMGTNGMLFYRGDQSIEQAQGTVQFTLEDKKYILSKLKENVDKLKEMGIDTYVLIAPNKENVYREYLPKTIQIKSEISRTEDLINYIRENSDINIVYPKDELLRVKSRYPVYRWYDTHWNKVGACIGAVSLQKKIDPNFSYNFSKMKVAELEERDSRDLANFANLDETLYENLVKVDDFYPDIEYKIEKHEKYEIYTSNSKNKKTVLFIGDSFREDMREYFSKLYEKVVYVHRDKYSKDILDKVKPNIVVFETVERYSVSLTNNLFK